MTDNETTAAPPKRYGLRVGIILAANFTLSALADFVDVLRLAADDGDGSRPIHCQWRIMSDAGAALRSSCGVTLAPTSRLIDPAQLDYVVVVGGLLHRGPQVGRIVCEYLQQAARARVPLIGLCTGSFILCRLGLLDGRKCCISWFHYRDFLEEFSRQSKVVPVGDQLFVIDGDRITCSGGAGVAFVAAHLVNVHMGSAIAGKALHMMQIGQMMPGSTAQPAPPFHNVTDDQRISRVLLLMEQNLARPTPVPKLAEKVGMSARQLERLFKESVGAGPRATYLQLRLKHARWMLSSALPLTAIAADTGFSDCAHLGRAFKAAYGLNPSEARLRLKSAGHRDAAPLGAAMVGGEEARRVFDHFSDRKDSTV